MAANSAQTGKQSWNYEFLLVVTMLGILLVLVICILWCGPPLPHVPKKLPDGATAEQVLKYQEELNSYLDRLTSQQDSDQKYRKDILAIIVTAFGAWVGAGAAYFFGRENLRESNSLMLRMHEGSPKDRLDQAKVSDLPLKALDIVVKATDLLGPVLTKLKGNNKFFFVTLISDQGKLVDVIHKEGIWRFVVDHADQLAAATIQSVLDYLNADQVLKRDFLGVYAPVKLDTTIGAAHDLMTKKDKEVFVAIVLNSEDRPMQFFDTGDVRKFLLK